MSCAGRFFELRSSLKRPAQVAGNIPADIDKNDYTNFKLSPE
jgi:hypothetical protein